MQTKDGALAGGKHVLIDGQQRITALMAAISGLEVLDEDFNKVVDKFTNKRYQTKSYKVSPTWASIEKFNEEGMEILEKEKVYKKIYSRVGSHESHFLALEYKLKHHETFWSAEFSDPLSITIDNKKRGNPKDN